MTYKIDRDKWIKKIAALLAVGLILIVVITYILEAFFMDEVPLWGLDVIFLIHLIDEVIIVLIVIIVTMFYVDSRRQRRGE